jgi:ribosome biogenesis GTPase
VDNLYMNKGIITKAIGGFFFVADCNGIHKTKVRGRIQKTIYPGDRVGFKDGLIEEIYPRNNLLFRPTIANVDQVGVVQSLGKPAFDRKLLDRFLLMVENQSLKPIIIINKMDKQIEKKVKQLDLDDYETGGYDICFVSAQQNSNFDNLINLFEDNINVLTGPSGVGKSTIINTLIEDANMRTRPISQRLNRGVHTTRHVELLNLDRGGWLADTPGFTSLDINSINSDKLKYYYPEFEQYLGHCKFNTCSHTHEPKCAVKNAVQEGTLSKKRYNSYKHFYQELSTKE